MNKQEMIKHLSDKLGLTRAETKTLLDATFDTMAELLAKRKSFTIQGFGTFSVARIEKRKGFNPLINKWMMLPRRLKPRFRAGDRLKERVNQK